MITGSPAAASSGETRSTPNAYLSGPGVRLLIFLTDSTINAVRLVDASR